VRILCACAFALSLFVDPYVAEISGAPAVDVEGDTRGFLLAEEGFLMKTSSLTEQGTRSAFSQGVLHTVEPGESIAIIAKQSFVSADTIRYANNLSANAQVQPGQKLLILPVDGVLHTVKRGQNLKTISELYSIPAETIREQNNIQGGYLLAGQQLIIPGGKPIVEVAAVPAAAKPSTKPATVPNTVTNVAARTSETIEPTYGIFQMPCDCYYTQYFGKGHYGIDLQHRGGSTIFATEAGTVIRADLGWNGGYGNVIEIDHGNGIITLYAHNKELYVKKGDQVARGEAIAFMGNTGRVHGPTGIHLHLEVQVNGVKKNPVPYLQQ
jgi:LysM repeat protein